MLRQVVTRAMVTQVLAVSGRGDRRSDGKLCAVTCVFFVLALTLFPRDGYRSVLSKLAGGTASLVARGQLVSSSALRQRRLSLGPEPFRLLFERIAGPVGTAVMPGVFWRGLRLASVDGTYFEVADTAVNAVFGRTRNQRRAAAFPQVHLVALIECGTRALLGVAFDVRRVCEQDLTRRLLDRMRPGMLVLADRGFPGWLLWVDAAAGGADLLWRISAAVRLVPDEVLPDGSWLATRHADKNIWKALAGRPRSVRVRVIEMVVVIEAADGSRRHEPYRLITTLLDHKAFPAGELAALYSQRWESELEFRDLKITQRGPRAVLRSKTPALVNQEIWAYLVTHQAIRRMIAATAADHRLDADRLSFTVALTVARDTVVRIRARTGTHPPEMTASLLANLGPSERRLRVCLRAVKRPNAIFPSKPIGPASRSTKIIEYGIQIVTGQTGPTATTKQNSRTR
ncbi:IS4 family transposase (plasmid) [Streptomyces sp. NBC_01454]|uniref:IS4 family transposase n=1 Tax=Streptomyces sp. NBC_01454 TaxID=2975867 RepID=UPI002E34D96D|nr:IS4 family transposase [Streptomyces sp. NBC_01454]